MAFDQGASERDKRIAVMRVIIDPQWRAIFKDYASLALYLDR
jgi:hypothetical protein